MTLKLISSRDNPQYKLLRQLATSAQARKKAAQSLLDGVHLCEAWLMHKDAPALCVVGEAGLLAPEVRKIVDDCLARQVTCLQLPDALFAPLSQVEHGVSLLFVVDTPAVTHAALKASAVLLDGVQDPGNLGSILRSAAAAGITTVYCGIGTAAAWSPKVLRAGMGAHFVLNIVENVDLAVLLQTAQVPVLATSSHTDVSLFDADLSQPLAWLFGNEGQGVSDVLLSAADLRIAIPHLGQIESLNVAACAAVCLFEQLRQRTRNN